MKRNYLLGAALFSTMLFSACSNTDELTQESESNPSAAVQEIVLQVANTGDGMTARAGRPLGSSEAKQTIENVKLIVCDNLNNIVADFLVSDWNTSSTEYTGGAHGRKKTITLTGKNKLTAGQAYTIYAFGYSSGSDYKNQNKNAEDIGALLATYGNGYDEAGSEAAGESVTSYNPSQPLTVSYSATDGSIAEEIFAGSATITPAADKGFQQPVILNRQVAGIFVYVKDIPYVADGNYLNLVASTKNDQLILGSFNSEDLSTNGENTSHNVVNGKLSSGNAKSTIIASVNLTEWFTNLEDKKTNGTETETADGLIDDGNNWKGNGTNYKNGSVFVGKFLIPFKATSGTTFTLQLAKEATSTTVVKEWIIKLPTKDVISNESLTYWNTSSFTTETNQTETQNVFSVLRNHLYGIGQKMADEGTNGPGGTEGGDDDDDPQPLNNKQELLLQVNDNWEVLHRMEIE